MLLTFEDRLSDSPLVERVWRSHSARAGEFTSVAARTSGVVVARPAGEAPVGRAGAFPSAAASTWEMVVTRLHGETTLTVRGPETRPTSAFAPADGEWLG